MDIFVSHPGATGKLYFTECPEKFTLTADDMRVLYCGVLGIHLVGGSTLEAEINKLTARSMPDIDMPEDVLKVERVLSLRGEA